jgi:hypothetical protein
VENRLRTSRRPRRRQRRRQAGQHAARAQQDNCDHQHMVVAMRGELAETVIVDPDRGCTPARSWRGSPARHHLTRSAEHIGVCWETLPPNHSGPTLKLALYDRYLWPHPHRP